MVDLAGIGGLIAGIAALITAIVAALSYRRSLKSLQEVVKPTIIILNQVRKDLDAVSKTTEKTARLVRSSPSLDARADRSIDQELRKRDLDLKQQALQWRQLEGAAKALGWLLERTEEENDEEY